MKLACKSCHSILANELQGMRSISGKFVLTYTHDYSKTVNSGPNETLHRSVLGTTKSSFQ